MTPTEAATAIERSLDEFERTWRQTFWNRLPAHERQAVLDQALATRRRELEAEARAHVEHFQRRRRRVPAAERWLLERDEGQLG